VPTLPVGFPFEDQEMSYEFITYEVKSAMTPYPQYRCRVCGRVLDAWLPVSKRPDGAMLLYHLGQQHPVTRTWCTPWAGTKAT
jgi:hypothetical protein